jgi:CubicO group peptidase (beta-lactamase class C family)
MPRVRLSLLLLALAVIPHRLPAQYVIGTRDSLTARVDSVFRAFDRTESPGCALGVYRDGRIAYARGYGMANLELGVPITPRTVFDIGSVSKEFAATSILLLQREGKLSLSDDLRRYFPEMPPYAADVTIRNLLNHTSGIRDMFTMMNLAGRSFDGVADTVDYLRVITRSAETNFPIGTRYLYSNSGFALLSQIVYRVSHQSLPVFLRQNVLDPLGMRDSRSLDDHGAIIANRAQGYAPRGTGFRIQSSQVDGTAGAGSMHTTIEDFARWDNNWQTGQVGFGMLADSLTVRGKLRNDSTINYALGIMVGSWRGLRTVGHDGAWAGYRAQYLRFPDQHLSVACFCNLTSSGPDTLAAKVAAIYLESAWHLAPDTIGAWDGALTSAPEVPMPPEQLRANEGAWHNADLGAVRRTRMVGDSLMIGTNAQRTRLVPLGGNRFRVGSTNTEVTFTGDSAGAPTRLESRGRGGPTFFRRETLASPDAAHLVEYAGNYRNDEIESTYAISPDSGRLEVRLGGRRLTLLDPVYRDAFASGLFLGEFTRDARGRINGLVVQSGRVRNLRFTRER